MRTHGGISGLRAFTLALLLAGGCKPVGQDEGDEDTVGESAGDSSTTSGDTSTTTDDSSTSTDSTSESSTTSTDTDESTSESSTDEATSETGTTTESETGTTSETETTTEGETGTTSETGDPDCELNDIWEPNPSADQPSMVTWQQVNPWSAYRLMQDDYLCAGEEDWYHFDVASLNYAEHFLYIRALIKDAGLCGLSCDDPVIENGPQHAMTIEVYRADNMQLLMTSTQQDGVISLNGPGGDDYAHELLIRVYSQTAWAEYPYRLSVEIRNYDGEDECEC
ncbi:hypothetical protein ACNOYE_21535 [Nannocystaceae bacterium ST9]